MVQDLLFNKNNFFSDDLPLLRRKQSAFEIEDLPGLWRIHWQLGDTILISTFYTRIDQACFLWGIISAIIFFTAQFAPINWSLQALLWSVLTVAGTVGMVERSHYWQMIEPISQVVGAWVLLMVSGLVITDLSIFFGWGYLLTHLCALWLVLNSLGYFYSSWKLRSRAFLLMGLLHLAGIAVLPYVGAWQFVVTGTLIGFSALLLAELQWDSHDICAHLAAQQPN
ncbi:hypothetical protein [Myxacorys almedinensis]|uniref:Uncharacterized protein n=1 Tax=Myxacorys almedinensis A TaxID=2690445 RepID=A0A8J7Z5W3_9CYAN|nr:hypothetical protein [Myxacorys almedinensis]NDJ16050.1 hypothetical protein [Myxacorys almedinensis A]